MTQPPPQQPGYAPPGYPPYPPGGGYAIPPTYRPRPVAPNGMPLAEFGDRLLAYLLDRLILTAATLLPLIGLGIPLMIAYVHAIEATANGQPANVSAIFGLFGLWFLAVIVVQFVATYLYEVTYQMRRGQTVGKRVMKLRIVDAETGTPMDYPGARKRFIIFVLLSWSGIGAYLDGLWQLWDPQKQTLHDKVARTLVVKVPT